MIINKRYGLPSPRYDDAFKAGAVHLVTEQKHPAKEVAEELGICIDTLKAWLKNAGHITTSNRSSNADTARLRQLESENKALKKTLAEKTSYETTRGE